MDYMPTKNASETIETLARKLERARIYNSLKDCETLEDFQALTQKYETLCKEDETD